MPSQLGFRLWHSWWLGSQPRFLRFTNKIAQPTALRLSLSYPGAGAEGTTDGTSAQCRPTCIGWTCTTTNHSYISPSGWSMFWGDLIHDYIGQYSQKWMFPIQRVLPNIPACPILCTWVANTSVAYLVAQGNSIHLQNFNKYLTKHMNFQYYSYNHFFIHMIDKVGWIFTWRIVPLSIRGW